MTFEQKLLTLLSDARTIETRYESELERAGVSKDMQNVVEYIEEIAKAWDYSDKTNAAFEHEQAERRKLQVV